MEQETKKSSGKLKNALYGFQGKVKKIFWVLGINSFLFILIFILLDVAFGEFLFYQYVFLLNFKEPKVTVTLNMFDTNAYNSVLKEWQDRDVIFKNASTENYPDPFK